MQTPPSSLLVHWLPSLANSSPLALPFPWVRGKGGAWGSNLSQGRLGEKGGLGRGRIEEGSSRPAQQIERKSPPKDRVQQGMAVKKVPKYWLQFLGCSSLWPIAAMATAFADLAKSFFLRVPTTIPTILRGESSPLAPVPETPAIKE